MLTSYKLIPIILEAADRRSIPRSKPGVFTSYFSDVRRSTSSHLAPEIMCLAIPGQIKDFDGEGDHFATVDVSGVKRKVNVDLLREEGLELDDWVLIHVGFAMSKISEEQAQEQLQLLRMLGESEAALEEVQGYSFDDGSPPEPPDQEPDEP